MDICASFAERSGQTTQYNYDRELHIANVALIVVYPVNMLPAESMCGMRC